MKFNFKCADSFDNFCKHNDIDYSIAYNELGFHPRGFVFKKSNGRFHIVLNGKYDINQLKQTVIHEIIHIMNNDLNKDKSLLNLCEVNAERLTNKLNIILKWERKSNDIE